MSFRLTVTQANGQVSERFYAARSDALEYYHGAKRLEPAPVRISLHRIDKDHAYQVADWQRERNTVTTREVITPNA